LEEKWTQYEGEREQYQRMPIDDSKPPTGFVNITIKPIKRRMAAQQAGLPSAYEHRPRVVEGQGTYALTQRSSNNLRIELKTIAFDVELVSHQFALLLEDTTRKLEWPGKTNQGT
jgi:hypothetical protein